MHNYVVWVFFFKYQRGTYDNKIANDHWKLDVFCPIGKCLNPFTVIHSVVFKLEHTVLGTYKLEHIPSSFR